MTKIKYFLTKRPIDFTLSKNYSIVILLIIVSLYQEEIQYRLNKLQHIMNAIFFALK